MSPKDKEIVCPSCARSFTVELDDEISLPPTGGDFDWCESAQSHDCPHCRTPLRVNVRVWLDDGRVEVRGVET